MMTDKTWRLKAAGYASFAVVSFLLSLYLTFDYDKLGPLIKRGLEKATKAQVEVAGLSSYWVSGIEIKSLKMKFESKPEPQAAGEEGEEREGAPKTLTMENIKLRLKLLPLLIGRRSLSFNARLAGGSMEGDISTGKKSLKLNAGLSNLMLERIPVSAGAARNFKLGGKMQGRIKLDVSDREDPAAWKGQMNIDLEAAKIYPFTYMGVDVPEIKFSKGSIKVDMEEGKANIDPIKLESRDLPVDLKGTMELRAPWHKSFLDLSGTIKPGSEFQKQVPFITSVFSPSQAFSYKGNLNALMSTF